MMGNTWKGEISRTILNIFRPNNGIDVLELQFLEELYEKTFVVPYVILKYIPFTSSWGLIVIQFIILPVTIAYVLSFSGEKSVFLIF